MKVIWKEFLCKVMVWLAAEIILNCVGLDDLADYSEFVVSVAKSLERYNNPAHVGIWVKS